MIVFEAAKARIDDLRRDGDRGRKEREARRARKRRRR
jgi:hypothetical protein